MRDDSAAEEAVSPAVTWPLNVGFSGSSARCSAACPPLVGRPEKLCGVLSVITQYSCGRVSQAEFAFVRQLWS